jgi:hypothetical protein
MKCIPISIRQAFNFAWPVFKQRFGLFTAVLLTIFTAWVTLEIVVIAGQRFGILLWGMMHLAFFIFVAGIEVDPEKRGHQAGRRQFSSAAGALRKI